MAFVQMTRAEIGAPLYDPMDAQSDHWFPINAATAYVTAAVEAARDVRHLMYRMAGHRDDRRTIKLLVTPVHSLGTSVRSLQREVDDIQRRATITSQRDPRVGDLGRELQRALDSDLRVIRNERGAHHDPRNLATPSASIELLVDALRPAICLWFTLMRTRGVFGWTRRPDAESYDLDYMSEWPEGVLMASPNLFGPMVPHDPRRLVFDEIAETADYHNAIALACKPEQQCIALKLP